MPIALSLTPYIPSLLIPKAGLVYAVATEDMDALTFGTPRLVRHLMGSTKEAPVEFDLSKALEVSAGGGRWHSCGG